MAPRRHRPSTRSSPAARGFTLVELLIAIAILAVIALMSWRGLDVMVRAQEQTRAHNDAHLILQTSLAQWQQDLDALQPLQHTQTLDWSGKTLRLTRRASQWPDPGVFVVAWTQRSTAGQDLWLRWQSPPLTTLAQWRQAWQQADQWARNPSETLRQREVALIALTQWSLLYFRGGSWVNPQSSTAEQGTAPAQSSTSLPQGILLQLTLPGRGLLTQQWVGAGAAGALP